MLESKEGYESEEVAQDDVEKNEMHKVGSK